MSSTVGFAADAVPTITASGNTLAGDAPPSSRTEHDIWSPLVVATLWWGLVAYGCGRALLAW
jgi:hypothetical protein